MLTRKEFLKALLISALGAGYSIAHAQAAGNKSLIVYYSWSGNTREIAQAIAKELKVDIYEIRPVTPYPSNYSKTVDLAKEELEKGARPAIVNDAPDLSQYSTILLGSPNWWSHVSMPVFTFMDQHDLSGKVIMPFITHGGGGLSQCVRDIRQKYPNADVREAYVCYGDSYSAEDIRQWLKDNKLL